MRKGGVGLMGYPHKPHAKETALLSKHFGDPDARTYKGWAKRGGYEAWKQAQTMAPAAITDVVKESGLRGRGGGGGAPPPPPAAPRRKEKKNPPTPRGATPPGPGGDPPPPPPPPHRRQQRPTHHPPRH